MSLRCLQLCWEYPPIVEGGLGRHVGALAPALAAQGVEVHVLTRGAPGVPGGERDGVAVHRVLEPARPDEIGPFVGWVERLNRDMLAAGIRLHERFAFDLVHGHDWLVLGAAEPLAGRLGCPLLMTIHATEHGRHGGWVDAEPQAGIHELERRAVHCADRLITCSVYMREHLVDVFGVDERRITVIANGVEVDRPPRRRVHRDAPEPPGSLSGAPRSGPVILLAGRLVYEKGVQLALAALPGLLERLGPLHLVIAGGGIHAPQLSAAAAALGLGEHVSFLGWVGPDVLDSLYQVADVCLVPSIYEPFGLVALEAMARGCPCVVADTGGLREIVPHGEVGLRFTARDAGSLAAMLELMLRDHRLRERLAAAALEHVTGFSWAAVATRTAGIYRRLGDRAAIGSRQ